ncbi:MAG: stage II sporulation protein M [Eubacterium sp.]|nr:stage II sporulation protein M [Eubacterium sp.]
MNKPDLSGFSVTDLIDKEKGTLYSLIFYSCGLVFGSFLYFLVNSTSATKAMKELFLGAKGDFLRLFFSNFSLYFSVFMVCILLGLCIVGFSVIYGVSLFSGLFLGLKIAYFYVNFAFKGFAYSILMIIPEGAALMTVLIYTIDISIKLSSMIYKSASGKEQGSAKEIKSLLTKYLVYALAVTLIALINSTLTIMLKEIIILN